MSPFSLLCVSRLRLLRTALAPLVFVILLLTAGCAAPGDTCRSYGFTPGTDAFAGCLQREAHQLRNQMNYILSR